MTTLAAIREGFRLAPDRNECIHRLDALIERGLDEATLASHEHLPAFVRIACAHAPYLSALAGRDLGRLVRASADAHVTRGKPRPVMLAELEAEMRGVGDENDLLRRLRCYRAQEMIRLGARECGLGQPEEVGRELSSLADVAFEVAIAYHDAELARQHGEPFYLGEDGAYHRANLAVIGMGKLGGRELNFSSDVDVIYFYPSDEGQAGELSLHEYFTKLTRKVTRALAEVTEDGLVFRVDLRLRPEGSRGPMCNSLPSAESYYESWGRPWERQAWMKARPCAGDPAVGAAALRMLEPFVYPRNTSPNVVREVHELNRKIKAELDNTRLGGGFDVKIGVGGIREVEFFVQCLQLIHAGKQPQLREASTRRALDRLLLAGLIAERERAQLIDAYNFLRQVEHQLQLEAGQQTQRLPGNAEALEALAWRLGLENPGELAGRLGMHTEAVARLFGELSTEPPLPPDIAIVLDPERGEDDTLAALGRLGFGDVEQAHATLEALRRMPSSPLSPSASPIAAGLAAPLVKEIAASPDPDQALAYLADLAARRGHADYVWALLEGNPPLLRLLVSLLGTSAFLARNFVRHPELVDGLLSRQSAGPSRNPEEVAARLDERMKEIPAGDDEAAWNALRRGQHEELLRIGLSDIAGGMEVIEVGERLTDLADACVQRAFAQVSGTLMKKTGRLPRLAVLAMGKLGARELGYAADLDLIFLYEGDFEDHELATRLAQRLTGALGAHLDAGRLYEIDTRLRPSGRQGTLVVSLDGFRSYHAESAQLWERQALIKLRPVAGDPAVGAAAEKEAQHAVFSRPPAANLAAEIAGMRARIEKELGQAAVKGDVYDVKVGPGGLIDIEFAAQYLQLRHGHERPLLRVRGTVAALDAAALVGVLDHSTRDVLVGGWKFLRRLEHRLRIVHDQAQSVLPRGADLDKLARRMGLRSAGALERQVVVWTRDVRACYSRLLG